MTLVEILVAAGMMSIIMLAFTQMFTNQQKATRALSEKLAVLDFQRLMASIIADGSVCKFDLTDNAIPANPGNPQKFTDTLPTPIPAISLTRLHSSAIGSPPGIFASVGSAWDPYLTVSRINLANISKLAPKQYRAEFQVSFTGGVFPLKAASASVVLQTDGGAANPGKETIVDCSLGGGSAAGYVSLDPPVKITNTTDGRSIWNSWRTFDASSTIPAGVDLVQIETYLANDWRVNWMAAKYRKNAAASALWLNASSDNDSQGTAATQGFYPIDPSTRTFQYWGNGSSGQWDIKIIGYYKTH